MQPIWCYCFQAEWQYEIEFFAEISYPTQIGSIALEPVGGLAFVCVEADSFREQGPSSPG